MKKIIILDDDKYFTSDLSELLEFEDVECTVFNSADNFINKINDIPKYSAIILDVMMRKGTQLPRNDEAETGELVYSEIRNKYPNFKVIIISAKNKSELTIDFNNQNTLFIGKPLSGNLDELLSILEVE